MRRKKIGRVGLYLFLGLNLLVGGCESVEETKGVVCESDANCIEGQICGPEGLCIPDVSTLGE